MVGRVEQLLAQMTLAEKIGQLNLVTPGGDTLTGAVVNEGVREKVVAGKIGSIFGIKSREAVRAFQDLAMQSRLKIPLMFAEDVVHGYRTVFPLPLALAASFDMALVERTARAAALETAAMGIDQTYAPMVDVCRDPRWGRIAESPGEDPHLAACFAGAMVRGFQGDDLACPEAVMACLKHFVAYGAAEGGRDYAAALVGPADLHDVYLKPFAAGVAAGAGSVMAAFNTVDGVPMHANGRLIGDVLRARFGFEGLVVADYTGVMELIHHGVAADLAGAAVRAIGAGVDLDMVAEAYLDHLEAAVAAGRVDPALVDAACRRVLEAKERLGLLADPYIRIDRGPPESVLLSPGHRELAREAVAASSVLLKNEDAVLPLKAETRVALVGPLADDLVNMNGTWAVCGRFTDAVSVRAGLEGRISLVHARGCDLVDEAWLADRLNVHDGATRSATFDPRGAEAMLAEAVAAARAADVVVAVVGEAKEYSGESSSRTDLRLPAPQRRLLTALKATGKPVVAVLMTGRPLVLTDVVADCDGLLVVWFGGTETGSGVADLLLGSAEPTGRLPATFPHHEGQIPVHHARLPTGRPFTGRFEKFRTGYVDVADGLAHDDGLFPFGFGLGYSEIAIGAPEVEAGTDAGRGTAERAAEAGEIRVAVPVENTGRRAGAAVVQLYVGDPVASRSRPIRQLAAFEKVTLRPGERRRLVFRLTAADLSFARGADVADTARVFEPGRFVVSAGPDSRTLRSIEVDWTIAV